MSLIIAYKDKNKVVMASDFQTTIENLYICEKHPSNFKVQRVGKYLIGSVGIVSCSQYVESNLEQIMPKQFTKKAMINEFYPRLIELMNKCSLQFDRAPQDNNLPNSFIIAKGNKMFLVSSGEVLEVDKICCSGSGSPYVRHLLEDIYQSENKREAALNALRACSATHTYVNGPYQIIDMVHSHKYVNGPYQIIDTKNLESEVVD